MKNHTIKTPTADLLVVELPRVCDYKLTKEMIFIMDKERSTIHRFKGSYTLLGKPDEISENDAKELVDKDPWVWSFESYRDYSIKPTKYNTLITAKESLLSLIESEIYWENPIKVHTWASENADIYYKQWHEAEQKTFDRNRTLIFKRNK